MRLFALILTGLVLAIPGFPAKGDDAPSFEDRVRAQESIERFYHARRTETRKPFEQAVARAVLEDKVRDYLERTVALQRFWSAPVTAEMLRRETLRIAQQSHRPEELRELFSALGNDPTLIQECLARRTLVERLTRNRFDYDSMIHDSARREAMAARGLLLHGRGDELSPSVRKEVVELVREDSTTPDSTTEPRQPASMSLSATEYEHRRELAPEVVGAIGSVTEERGVFVIRVVEQEQQDRVRIARYTVDKRKWHDWWNEVRGSLDITTAKIPLDLSAELPDPQGTRTAAHDPEGGAGLDFEWRESIFSTRWRSGYTAVWTGSEMIVWGDFSDPVTGKTGMRYDPVLDVALPISTVNAPDGHWSHTMVWTGSEVIVWGGIDDTDHGNARLNTGARYDPVSDSWSTVTTQDAPSPRQRHVAVWADDEMIVWGGHDSFPYYTDGGRYDPVLDQWSPMTTALAPQISGARAVWTGTHMVVWALGGAGGRYRPSQDRWTSMTMDGAPDARSYYSSVWTGSEIVIWGGSTGGSGTYTNEGATYRPNSDSWLPMSTLGAPQARDRHGAVWTGDDMIVWGGYIGTVGGALNDGGRYDPQSDSWQPMSVTGAPSPRTLPTALWTGDEMLVWGPITHSGGLYDPSQDTWSQFSTAQDIPNRGDVSLLWTGAELILWHPGLGARYDPLLQTMTPMSTLNEPPYILPHPIVWSGSEMLVWGGLVVPEPGYCVPPGPIQAAGGRYDPVTDVWSDMTNIGEPIGRHEHHVVWTGDRMLVWGGSFATCRGPCDEGYPFYVTVTGAAYDPGQDVWTPMPTSGAPSRRIKAHAVWSGREMLVWGGRTGTEDMFNDCDYDYHNDGAAYDPATGVWRPLAEQNAPVWGPSLVDNPRAVWSGREMIVSTDEPEEAARYDPEQDVWTPLSTTGAPSPRGQFTAIWAGSEMVVWGGVPPYGVEPDSGARYDPGSNSWLALPSDSEWEPEPLRDADAVWTGREVFVVGGGTHRPGGELVALGPDGDVDGVVDGVDNCSAVANASQGDFDVDGVGDACDNCPQHPNAGQGPVSLAWSILATSEDTFAWPAPVDGLYVRGDLALVSDYATLDQTQLFAATTLTDANAPVPGSGLYFLVRLDGDCSVGSWQTVIGAEPARDAGLP